MATAENQTMEKRLTTELKTLRNDLKERAENLKNTKSGKAKDKSKSDGLKLLIGIVSAKDAEKLTELCNTSCAALSYEAEAKGTASSSVLDYLGLGETDKRIVLSLLPASAEEATLQAIGDGMSLYLVGKGICFTVPLTGASTIVANALKKSVGDTEKNGGKKVKTEREYSLIVTAMQKGFTEEAMEAARQAGAAGGTVVTAATLGDKKAEQLIGVTLQKETDVLLILAKDEGKQAIIDAILNKVGLKTDGGGVVFTLPVDNIAGIGAIPSTSAKRAEENGDNKDE